MFDTTQLVRIAGMRGFPRDFFEGRVEMINGMVGSIVTRWKSQWTYLAASGNALCCGIFLMGPRGTGVGADRSRR